MGIKTIIGNVKLKSKNALIYQKYKNDGKRAFPKCKSGSITVISELQERILGNICKKVRVRLLWPIKTNMVIYKTTEN